MKQVNKSNAFGVIFVLSIALVFFCNLFYNGGIALASFFTSSAEEVVDRGNQKQTNAIQAYADSFFLRTPATNALHNLQNLTGGKFVFQNGSDDLYQDEDGRLTYICKYVSTKKRAESLADFSSALQKSGIPLLYVQAPFKILRNENNLHYRVQDYANANADRFLTAVSKQNVDVFDLRDVLIETDRVMAPLFFYTDSRWQIGTAFDAYTSVLALVDHEYHLARDTATRFGSDSNFAITKIDSCFLGNQGAAAGLSKTVKLDSFETVTPYSRTSFTIEVQKKDGKTTKRSGDYTSALMVQKTGNTGLFDQYLSEPTSLIRIHNQLVSGKERILIVGDDFVNPFASFMALNFEETVVVNPLYYSASVLELAESFDPDLVLVLYNPKSFETDAYFHFGT